VLYLSNRAGHRTGRRAGGRTRRAAVAAVLAAAALPATAGTAALAAAGPASAIAAGNAVSAGGAAPTDAVVRLDGRRRLQPIDGFGFASPFQRATLIRGDRGLSPANQRRVLDLLFSRTTGVGASILRMGIGSSSPAPYDLMPTIEPTDPGGPKATPQYVWTGDDGGQVWLTQQAKAYGVERFYFDAWSAPGFMKTNADDRNGGTLCGLAGAACASGDWRQAYANYLIQFVRFYRQAGIKITDLGFTNEPDFVATYASMNFTPAQAVEFIKVLGPTIKRSRLGLNLICCDGADWVDATGYSAAIEADPVADRLVGTQSGHVYGGPAATPFPTDDRTWMSEWNPNGNTWNEAWDDGSGWAGITIAESIHNALAVANNSAYVYWTGASLGATRALIQVPDAGDGVAVSKRLWALAAYSRFIRPGAVRIVADTADPALKVTAFRNQSGNTVVELLNTATTPVHARVAGSPGARATTYRTDETHSLARIGSSRVSGGHLPVDLPARSLTTVVLTG
jgi:glucuronoarabinoxylan endo-1,4-beta-xylanase